VNDVRVPFCAEGVFEEQEKEQGKNPKRFYKTMKGGGCRRPTAAPFSAAF